MRARALILLPLFVMAGCAGPSISPDPPEGPVPVQRFRSEPIAFAFDSGFTIRERLVVKDQERWSEVWQRLHEARHPVPERPAVDFEREMVVVAALGERPTGGHGILIESAVEEADGLRVRVLTTTPGPTCVLTQALTQPVDLARVPRHGGEVRFDERTEVRDCS